MKAAELQVGDIVFKPNGFMDWPKWEHTVRRISEGTVYTVFDNGMPDSAERHQTAIRQRMDWMSKENMDSCLQQPGTAVMRNEKVIYSSDIKGAQS